MANEGLKDIDLFRSYERQAGTASMVILGIQLLEP